MASISELVNQLQACKQQLEENQASVLAASQLAEEVATQTAALDLNDKAAALMAVKDQIDSLVQQYSAFSQSFDDIINSATAVMGGP
jgi:hypothetical protein